MSHPACALMPEPVFEGGWMFVTGERQSNFVALIMDQKGVWPTSQSSRPIVGRKLAAVRLRHGADLPRSKPQVLSREFSSKRLGTKRARRRL